ncbi:MAG TPA: hypothetical protein VFO67_19675 [Gemmatimonadales bacterium]|nr:hypothetical protein [Gemmatimonadales bacterium]
MNRNRAVIVELVGPAGAGKTTLARGASETDSSIKSGLSLWGLPKRRLLSSAIALLPTILRATLKRSRLTASETAQMIRLGALRQVVAEEAQRHRVIILDEGPVFALSWLDVFFARNRDHATWRRRVIAQWARLLDVVVFIDASDITLAHRIRTREKPHMVKALSDAEIFGFSDGFRRAFERAIGELAQAGPLVVDTLRTDTGPPDENTANLMARLKLRRNGH